MSRRIVWPYAFTLQVNELVEAFRSGATKRLTEVQSQLPKGAPAGTDLGIPTALRWSTLPWLGIPRQPFQVYRRQRTPIPATAVRQLVPQPVSVNGTVDVAVRRARGSSTSPASPPPRRAAAGSA